PIGKPADVIESLALFERPYYFADGNLSFAANNVVHIHVFIHFAREARIVTADGYLGVRFEGAYEFDHASGRPALKGHDRKADEGWIKFVKKARDGFANPPMNQDQIGNRYSMVRVNVAGKRGQCSVRHAHRYRRHVLKVVGHGEQQNVHLALPLVGCGQWAQKKRNFKIVTRFNREWSQLWRDLRVYSTVRAIGFERAMPAFTLPSD